MLKPTKHISKFGKKELDNFFTVAKAAKKNQAFTILKAPATHVFGKILIMVPKAYGNAPERNKLKRRFKAIFINNKLYEHRLDLVIITRPTAKNYDFDKLSQLLIEIFA
ncbi:ribonuclease P protein component [Candidatus Dependentiae bacterium]|nr:ribonuclease P protein component [Candidatus Dependentiae bacterium]